MKQIMKQITQKYQKCSHKFFAVGRCLSKQINDDETGYFYYMTEYPLICEKCGESKTVNIRTQHRILIDKGMA